MGLFTLEPEPTKTDTSISHVPFILFFTLPQGREFATSLLGVLKVGNG